jgi:multidrug efflux pump subunit AcrB
VLYFWDSLLFSKCQKNQALKLIFPVAIVTTPFLGASATDVEELVTRPLEDKIKSLTNIDTLTSVSMQGISSITVNFDVDADSLETMTDLRSKVDLALLDLPSDAETPTIQKVSFF